MSNNKNFNKKSEEKGIENIKEPVPYIAHEYMMVRMERQIKRLWIALVIAILSTLITNLAWIYYESQFETVSYSQDGEGLNNINTGSQGDIYGSESEDKTP